MCGIALPLALTCVWDCCGSVVWSSEAHRGSKTDMLEVCQPLYHVKALDETNGTVVVRVVSDACVLRKSSWEVVTAISHLRLADSANVVNTASTAFTWCYGRRFPMNVGDGSYERGHQTRHFMTYEQSDPTTTLVTGGSWKWANSWKVVVPMERRWCFQVENGSFWSEIITTNN